MYFSSERILMEVAVVLLMWERAFVVLVLVYHWGDISVVPGNCITSYEMSAERVILNPSFFVTKP
jgi:hypothetical protein